MTVYQSPWARNFKRMTQIKNIAGNVMSAVCGFIIMSFMMWAFIHCIEQEARHAEQKRIYRMLKAHDKSMELFIADMEKAGRGNY